MDYLIIYNTLDSTNLEAHRLLATGHVQNGMTLLALEQTQGRGQMGRVWVAEPGSHLSMTIFFRPEKMESSDLSTLGMKISLGIAEALQTLDPALYPLIKWPNDIYIGNKKLCGILIENALSGYHVQHSIIGIGMNVNEHSFPPDIPNAVSLHNLTGKKYNTRDIALLLRHHVLSILELESPAWKTRYDQLVFGQDKVYSFKIDQRIFEAIVRGVSNEGHLLLEIEDGKLIAMASHQVKWII